MPLLSNIKKTGFELVTVFILLLACPIPGQAQHKKQVTEADYSKWGNLWINGLSGDGNWTSFEMTYENQRDTLFVKHTETLKQYLFPEGKDGKFGGNELFACLMPGKQLRVLRLKTGNAATVPEVSRYDFIADGKYLVTFNDGLLTIRNADGNIIDTVTDVEAYVINEKTAQLLYSTNGNVGVVNFKNYKRSIISNDSKNVNQLTWQDNGKVFAYLTVDAKNESQILKFYSFAEKRMSSFEMTSSDFKIYGGLPIKISNDGKKVFVMAVSKNTTAAQVNQVEVWNGNDGELYQEKQRLAAFGDLPKVACWRPDEETFKLVSSDSLPNLMISNNGDYAILSNRYQYGRTPTYYESVDYHIKNIRTGAETLFLKQQSHDPNQIGFAAFQNNIVYYKNGDWWLYNINGNSHINITKGLDVRWDNTIDNAQNQFTVYGNPGWTSDGKSVLLYDAFDLWLISLDGTIRKRLTNGRENGLVYRISQVEFGNADNYDGRRPAVIDLGKDILMDTLNPSDWSAGYSVYSNKKGSRQLVYGAANYSQVRKSHNGFTYVRETFNEPPRIEFVDKGTASDKVIYQSNKQQQEFEFGKAALLHYKDAAGHDLKGTLFYPAGFDPAKKYPMVVWIYDVVSNRIHQYVNPSNQNGEGFNITNYTLNGYLVLLPDFYYVLGNPGISAVSGVTAGVTEVINMGIVDSEKIGLIGHSFGGYETNFIITQTKLFKAAVSGAGISDIVGQYFNITKNGFAIPDMWRFESQQWRMGKSLYADKEAYLRNWPIMYADSVSTPLLLWCGKNDRSVPMNQSVTYYLGLRRLGKKCIFLAYPNEGHSLTNPENEKDLTYRVSDWFDYFLKQKPCKWIEAGTKEN